MVEGIVFMLVASVWFVFRKRIAAYQVYLITERFRVVPVKDKTQQVQGMNVIGILFCSLLVGAGALIVALHFLLDSA